MSASPLTPPEGTAGWVCSKCNKVTQLPKTVWLFSSEKSPVVTAKRTSNRCMVVEVLCGKCALDRYLEFTRSTEVQAQSLVPRIMALIDATDHITSV